MKILQEMEQHKMKGLGPADIGPVALSIGAAIIMVGVTALILAEMGTASDNGNFTAIINKGLVAIGSFADWFGIIIIVVVAVIILAMVMMLGGAPSGGGGRRRRGRG